MQEIREEGKEQENEGRGELEHENQEEGASMQVCYGSICWVGTTRIRGRGRRPRET